MEQAMKDVNKANNLGTTDADGADKVQIASANKTSCKKRK